MKSKRALQYGLVVGAFFLFTVITFLALFNATPATATDHIPVRQADAQSLPVLVGFYGSAELYNTINELDTLEDYFGQPTISMAGTFVDFESPAWVIRAELNTAWDHGYIPFVNISAGTVDTPWTAEQIANGALDDAIRQWARIYKEWTQNGQKRAFLAPLQEMNGEWVSYSHDPSNYIRAYLRIQRLFAEEGVPRSSVNWVFAPNGWHDPEKNYPFEYYYPGNSAVDAVGFSSFNFGSCWWYTSSQSYEEIYRPYLERMSQLAPGKPIFVAEIGSVAVGLDRAAWFQDTLTKIANYPGVRGILYFNRYEDPDNYLYPPKQECRPVDYTLDANGGEGKEAFKQVVTQPPYGHLDPLSTGMDTAFNPPDGVFEDVWPASAFSGLPDVYYQDSVDRLAASGITSGCRSQEVDLGTVGTYVYKYYCPKDFVTRAQMAVFLEKGMHFPDAYTPPDVEPTFPDTGGHWAEDWIEALRADGITSGYPDGTYRPNAQVTRAQMAVFLLKAKHGADYQPPAVEHSRFSDVPDNHWAKDWIEELAVEGITAGYPDGTYRPDRAITRAEMAVFLTKTFDLP